MPTNPLTIGELFPSDDIVGQWIVSMSLLNDDLVFITDQLKAVTNEGDLRGMLYLQRQWIIRLYEAYGLVRAADRPEVAEFIGEKPPPWLEALRQRYLPARAGEDGEVKQMYEQTRHQSVHYSHLGSDDLREALDACRWIPARVVMEDRRRLTATWAQAVSAMRLFGDMRDAQFFEKYKARSELLGHLAHCWLMLGHVVFMVYVRGRGLDMNRVVEIHGTLLADLPDPPAA